MSPRHLGIWPGFIGLLAALALAGCGGSSLTASQLRARATRVCTAAARRMNAIPTPGIPSQGEAFVSRGVSALSRELSGLRAIRGRPSSFRDGLAAKAAEVALLRSTVKGLRAGNDPVVAIKTLEQQLEPVEVRADAAWQALGIPACVNR
jgi:hypothetical protein